MSNPTTYAVELRDKNFKLIKRLENITSGLRWRFNSIGGCGTCTHTLKISNLPDIGPDYDLQIYMGGVLLYRGYSETYKPTMGSVGQVTLTMQGYSGQLKRVRIKATYENLGVSEIVKDILSTYVTPDTSILYDASKIDESSYAVDQLVFDTMADDAISTLAGLEGNIEWGVDATRTFYFKKKTNDIENKLRIGIDISTYEPIEEYGDIVNRLYVKGGKVNGVTYEAVVDVTESQNLYGKRDDVISNSAIVTASVAQQYGTMYLIDKAIIQKRSTAVIPNNTIIFESSLPIKKIYIIKSPVPGATKYGAAKYGTFKYGSLRSYEINMIDYEMQNQNVKATLNLGVRTPDIAELIKRLDYEIGQLQAQ